MIEPVWTLHSKPSSSSHGTGCFHHSQCHHTPPQPTGVIFAPKPTFPHQQAKAPIFLFYFIFFNFCATRISIFINHHYFLLSSDFKSDSIAQFSFQIPQSREDSDKNKVQGRGCFGHLKMHWGSLFQHFPKLLICILGEYIKA